MVLDVAVVLVLVLMVVLVVAVVLLILLSVAGCVLSELCWSQLSSRAAVSQELSGKDKSLLVAATEKRTANNLQH